MSKGEDTLELHLKAHKIPYQREFRFHPERKWRADFYVPPDLLIEIDGGVWIQGRHNRGQGYIQDMDKLNSMVRLGYRVLRFEPKTHVESGLAIELIQLVLSDGRDQRPASLGLD